MSFISSVASAAVVVAVLALTNPLGMIAQAWVAQGDAKFVGDPYVKDVYFDFDKSDLRPDALAAAGYDVDWIYKNKGRLVFLEGHADSRGSKAYNVALAQRRIETVESYLIGAGIPADRIHGYMSFGKEKPQCLGENEKCWQLNRRVHVMVNAPDLQKP